MAEMEALSGHLWDEGSRSGCISKLTSGLFVAGKADEPVINSLFVLG